MPCIVCCALYVDRSLKLDHSMTVCLIIWSHLQCGKTETFLIVAPSHEKRAGRFLCFVRCHLLASVLVTTCQTAAAAS